MKDIYLRGWEIDSEDDKDIQHINDDVFVMPAHDVTIRAVWSTHGITKSMVGTVYENQTLFKLMANRGNDASDTSVKKYTGEVTDTYNLTKAANNVYYYNGDGTDNNVVFADKCWKIVRTTETGGVKVVYNGEYDDELKCSSTRGTHMGYSGYSSTSLSSNYYYGTDFTYDESTKTFSLAGDLKQERWSDSTYQNLIGLYTCKSTSETGTCSTLYRIDKYYSNTSGYALTLKDGTNYAQIGSVPYNDNYNSPAYVGYMYNDVYKVANTSASSLSMLSKTSLNTTYPFGDNPVYASNVYTLENEFTLTDKNDYQSIVGKYQKRSNTSLYYVVAADSSNIYYISLSSGKLLNDMNTTYSIGDGLIDNGDGSFTISSPTTISKTEYYSKYEEIRGKYFCLDGSATCNDPKYISGTSNRYIYYINTGNYIFGNDVEYVDGKYHIKSDDIIQSSNWEEIKSSLTTHHYTCLNNTGICENIYYINYLSISSTSSSSIYAVSLTDGSNISEALEKMIHDSNVNKNNSPIKTAIDNWYERNMLDYSEYLEDFTFCNDRSVRNLGAWNPNGGGLISLLQFKNYSSNTNLSCSLLTDSFSINNESAKLSYPVGLVTVPEALLIGTNARKTGSSWWLGSPGYFYSSFVSSYAGVRYVDYSGGWSGSYVFNAYGVRPAVSLIPGIEYTGAGTEDEPYEVFLQ